MKSLFTIILLLPIVSFTLSAQTVAKTRTAALVPGGYTITGSAIIEELSDGTLQLRLSDDFSTPPGPDVQVLLSDDPKSIGNSIFISDIGTDSGGLNHFNGAITFDVPSGVVIDQYDYVVFFCVEFGLHWADGTFGVTEVNDDDPLIFECKESLTATTDWVSAVTICTNDGMPDIVPIKNSIGELAGEHYSFIITDINDKIEQVVTADELDFEGSGVGTNRVYGVSHEGTLNYNQGDLYTSITASGCAILSSSITFLTVTKESCRASIQGRITDPNGNAVEGFQVFLNDETSTTTNAEGRYVFNDLATNNSYTVAPKENGNVSQGISTKDLVTIRKHILGVESFSNNFQIIAADISNNGSISTKDQLELQKLIIGITDVFENNQSYRFVCPADITMESVTFENLLTDQSEVDFIAIKIGDVSAINQ